MSSFVDSSLSQCPTCNENTLKVENGCGSCLNEECGWGKCDS